MEAKHRHDNDDDAEERDGAHAHVAPTPEVVALREGYNQTYIIRSSATHLHDALFRCGNWCYGGRVDLGGAALDLTDLPAVIPALQKQQGSLQYLCEWKQLPAASPYAPALEMLYDVIDWLGAQLASPAMEHELTNAATEHPWVDADDPDEHCGRFFELATAGDGCFDAIDLVASKTFVRGLVLVVVYYQRSFYAVLHGADGEQPLLDVRFPDLSAHLQGVPLRVGGPTPTTVKRLTLWQAVTGASTDDKGHRPQSSPARPVRVQCKDVSGRGYNQTFLIRRTPPSAGGDGVLPSGPSLREVLFRFGQWCYNGHVDLGPQLELADIPVIIPLLRRQQSALTFMCEVSKMPATALFTPAMEFLAEAVPAIQGELARAERLVQSLGDAHAVASARRWLDDDDVECFFELGLAKCAALRDVEAIASKIYLDGGVVLVLLYFDFTFYAYVESGDDEQPLLDTAFPDVSFTKEGLQLETYKAGVPGCDELRRLSLWRVVSEEPGGDNDEDEDPTTAAVTKDMARCQTTPLPRRADAKASERRREEGVKKAAAGDEDHDPHGGAKAVLKKAAHPHHIAPLKSVLHKMPDLGLKAPWDETGRPLGLRVAK